MAPSLRGLSAKLTEGVKAEKAAAAMDGGSYEGP